MAPLLTAKEVTEILYISRERVYELVDQGNLVAVRIGGVVRIPRNRVLSLLDETTTF